MVVFVLGSGVGVGPLQRNLRDWLLRGFVEVLVR